ncbi:toxic anion resistance protein [Thiobacillus sp.]|uniref:toxic anion resistance protein n=1 Tax=Thiobacillus sp. TaxID=924 RepID=UPI0025DD85AD|nr:toxic anion resistance protein [Thiobacillus sp.]MBT9539555.1 toxic anion resistance protein [Thiobacillus sp.]
METQNTPIVLTPPEVLTPVATADANLIVALKPERADALAMQVETYVQGLLAADLGSEEFRVKLDAANALGRQSIASSSALTGRFMDKNFVGFSDSLAFKTINELRTIFADLNPSRAGDLLSPHKLFGLIPYGNKLQAYFRKFDSAGGEIAKLMRELRTAQEEIKRDITALADMEGQLWEGMNRIREAAFFAEKLDGRLVSEVASLKQTNLLKAEAVEQEVLFYVRQVHSDLLAQQLVNINAYRQIGILKKTGRELVNGCDRMATTGMSALATAQAVARAVGAQTKVMEMLNAGSAAIGDLIEQTSVMIGKHVETTGAFSSDPVIAVEQLKTAFDNTSRAMDAMDTFRSQALDTMSKNTQLLKGMIETAERDISARRGAVDAPVELADIPR